MSKPRRASTPLPALQAAMSDAETDPVRRAIRLDALEQLLRPLLPPVLAGHCRLANVTGNRLVYLVDSPVWKAKLRLAAPRLVDQAQSIGMTVTEVMVKTTLQPLHPAPAAGEPTAGISISASARAALQAALDSLDAPGNAGTPAKPGDSSSAARRPKR
nr:DciA family protein [Pseudoxanthomonas kalamensis]